MTRSATDVWNFTNTAIIKGEKLNIVMQELIVLVLLTMFFLVLS